jgi:mono/diheme cytochrome c family protein
MRTTTACLLASAALGLGCSSHGGEEPAAPLVVLAVPWNPSNVDVGTVQAVAEQDGSVIVFGSKGVQTLTSGSLVTSDESVTAWRSAAVVPSADGLSTWMVGVDDAGRLQRVLAVGAPDDVSDRYGLASDKVQSIVGGAGRVAFLLENSFAVGDGTSVTRYKVPARAIAATGSLVALADGGTVRIFDEGKERDIALADAQLVAYDGAGNLMAATTHALFQVSGGSARQVFDAGARTIHQIAGAGSSVWLTVDGDLGVWHGGHVALAAGGKLTPDARLVGSPSGDVWVLADGQLLRWSAQGSAGAGGDEATWNATVLPVYAAVCSNCHSPRGSGKDSSNVDLSTYGAWTARRGTVYGRVVTQAGTPTSMPPPTSNFAITDAQRSAIEAWSKP